MRKSVNIHALVMACLLLAAIPAFAGHKPVFKTLKEKSSYAIGLNIGRNLKKDGIQVDVGLLAKGIKDAMTEGKTFMTDKEIRETVRAFQKELREKEEKHIAALGDKAANQAFLEKNKTKKGVKVLPSGLQYRILKKGSGKSPKLTDRVTVDYRGTLIDGTEFDSSYRRGNPATFQVSSVIKGWTEALRLMKVGATWQIVVPADLAYGASGRPGIPKNATLIFEIKLLSIKEKK
jgi:FKBP-type peptidyl-prolyl cis-trans isomerase FklB